ncbi:unnamed protein product, partial [Mycena citricolor]
ISGLIVFYTRSLRLRCTYLARLLPRCCLATCSAKRCATPDATPTASARTPVPLPPLHVMSSPAPTTSSSTNRPAIPDKHTLDASPPSAAGPPRSTYRDVPAPDSIPPVLL